MNGPSTLYLSRNKAGSIGLKKQSCTALCITEILDESILHSRTRASSSINEFTTILSANHNMELTSSYTPDAFQSSGSGQKLGLINKGIPRLALTTSKKSRLEGIHEK